MSQTQKTEWVFLIGIIGFSGIVLTIAIYSVISTIETFDKELALSKEIINDWDCEQLLNEVIFHNTEYDVIDLHQIASDEYRYDCLGEERPEPKFKSYPANPHDRSSKVN